MVNLDLHLLPSTPEIPKVSVPFEPSGQAGCEGAKHRQTHRSLQAFARVRQAQTDKRTRRAGPQSSRGEEGRMGAQTNILTVERQPAAGATSRRGMSPALKAVSDSVGRMLTECTGRGGGGRGRGGEAGRFLQESAETDGSCGQCRSAWADSGKRNAANSALRDVWLGTRGAANPACWGELGTLETLPAPPGGWEALGAGVLQGPGQLWEISRALRKGEAMRKQHGEFQKDSATI